MTKLPYSAAVKRHFVRLLKSRYKKLVTSLEQMRALPPELRSGLIGQIAYFDHVARWLKGEIARVEQSLRVLQSDAEAGRTNGTGHAGRRRP